MISKGITMKRSALAGAVLTAGTVLGVLAPVAGSTAAWAAGPQHAKATFPFHHTFPAGQVCDFALRQSATISENAITFPDRTIEHLQFQITHTNLATGSKLTETDRSTVFTAADGQTKQVGIFWHLRNAEGKIVVVQAGQLVLSAWQPNRQIRVICARTPTTSARPLTAHTCSVWL
jgi:hypothetical protein